MKRLLFVCTLIGLLAFIAHSQTCDVQPLKVVVPPYPVVSLALKESGKVVVLVTIDKEGNVTSSESVEGSKWLRKSSELVAKEWKFSAATSATSTCKTRSADLTFDYVVLPAGTPRGPQTQSYFLLPFHVTVQEIQGIVIDPSGRSGPKDRTACPPAGWVRASENRQCCKNRNRSSPSNAQSNQ